MRKQSDLGLIVVLLLAHSLFAPLSASADASSAPEARIYGPQEVYVGTDATFLIQRSGLWDVQVLIRSGSVSKSVATELELTRLDGSWLSMTVSGKGLQAGVLQDGLRQRQMGWPPPARVFHR